jgi:small ligand-binding sensory domain FIST
MTMKCAVGLSTLRNTPSATSEVIERVVAGLDGESADLAFVFASPHHTDALDAIGKRVLEKGLAKHVLGCTGESIIGEGHEVEGQSALAIWTIALPGTTLTPVQITSDDDGFHGWDSAWDRPSPDDRTLIVLGDPFRFPVNDWLKTLAKSCPGLKVCGGMSSGGSMPGQIRLMLDGQSYADGAVGLLIDGPARIRPIVSQGCRPIGRHLLVTSASFSRPWSPMSRPWFKKAYMLESSSTSIKTLSIAATSWSAT